MSSPMSRRRFVSGTLVACVGLAARSQAASIAQPRVLRITKSGFDSTVPGPELRVKRGEEVAVRVLNELDEPTAVHWHGVRLANAMDGAPPLTQAALAPGETFDYRFIAPDAGTFWYHSPQRTNSQLYGALIVTEPEPLEVDQDRTLIFTGSGQSADDKVQLNGSDFAFLFAKPNERIRLRLLNACISQVLRLRIRGPRIFVMATDGQPAQSFVARDGQVTLGAGNRMDVFVDCPAEPENAAMVTVEGANGVPTLIAKLLSQEGAAGRATRREDPKALPPNSLPERMDFRGAVRIEAAAGENRADKKNAPLYTVKRGRTIMLGLSNPTSENRFIHLHGHSFRLLDELDDGWKPFWLDTMPMAPRGKARIAFVADNPGKWLIEGLVDGLAENSADAWFEVT